MLVTPSCRGTGVRRDLDVQPLGIKTISLCPKSGLPESQRAARPSPSPPLPPQDDIEQKLLCTQHRFQLSQRQHPGAHAEDRRRQPPAGQPDFELQKPSCANAPSPRRLLALSKVLVSDEIYFLEK